MKILNDQELVAVSGGTVSNDTAFSAAIAVSVFALGALVVIASGGLAAPAVAVVALGVLGTGANVAAGIAAT